MGEPGNKSARMKKTLDLLRMVLSIELLANVKRFGF